jgi:hypothetical protein
MLKMVSSKMEGLKSILFTFIPFDINVSVKKNGTFDQIRILLESPLAKTVISFISIFLLTACGLRHEKIPIP